MTFTTDANGEILIEGLRIGEYVVTELENGASEGYEIAEPVTVTLVANETLTVNVHNNKITVDVPKTGDEQPDTVDYSDCGGSGGHRRRGRVLLFWRLPQRQGRQTQ